MSDLELRIREASPEDVDLIYTWSNDPGVRQNSFYSEPISYASHRRWYEKKLKDENSSLYIISYQSEPTGLVRFDNKPDNISTIGILLDSAFRGKGLSKRILNLGVAAFEEKNEKRRVYAYIKKTNLPSIRLFQNAGFTFSKMGEQNDVECLVYVYESGLK